MRFVTGRGAKLAAAACVAAGVAAGVMGWVAPIGAADPDPERGRALFETCRGCHAVEGYYNVYPTYRVPKLGGQSAGYIISALNAYKQGARKHDTMHANAASLSEQDIIDIAEFLASYED